MDYTDGPSSKINIVLRKVTRKDAEVLLNWRNLPSVREFSKSSSEIGVTTHEKWFLSRISNPLLNEFFFIIEQAGSSAGTVRADLVSDGVFKISIIVDSNYRGRGIAKEAIYLLLQLLKEKYPNSEIRADVHKDNLVSINLFKKIGFKEFGQAGNFRLFKKLMAR